MKIRIRIQIQCVFSEQVVQYAILNPHARAGPARCATSSPPATGERRAAAGVSAASSEKSPVAAAKSPAAPKATSPSRTSGSFPRRRPSLRETAVGVG